MTYSGAQMDAAVAALVRQVHGIKRDVAHAWATAEQGVHFNILGVTHVVNGHQVLFQYRSWDEGAAAAYRLIETGPYGGIRRALERTESQAQAQAIIASPWNHPYYSHGGGARMLRDIALTHPDGVFAGMVSIVPPGADLVTSTGAPAGHVTRATYHVGTRVKVRGLWQYPIEEQPGKFVRPTRYTKFS